MGRRALPEEQRLPKGRTQEEREARVVAQVRIHPALQRIPEPDFVLGPAAREKFDYWARRLHETGLLTVETLQWVNTYALAFDTIQKVQAAGKTPSAAHLKALNDAQIRLEKLNVDVSLTPVQAAGNRFKVNGFPARMRRDGRN